MKRLRTLALVGAAAGLAATAALAQVNPTPAPAAPPLAQPEGNRPPPPPPPPPPGGKFEGRPGGDFRGWPQEGGKPPGGLHHFGGPGGPGGPPPGGKGASLRYDRQGGFSLKCADDESTKACLDAAQPMIEKLLQQR